MSKRFITVLLSLLIVGAQAFAQNTVSGKVTDGKGEAIPGASVMVKGTQTGTMTNVDGSYSLSVRPGSTLVFSCIGFKNQEVVPGSRSVVNVVLEEDSEMLDEVVYVAYGTAKKKDLTGSISTVENKTLEIQAQGSVTRALEGSVAGLQTTSLDGQPGVDMGIRIRGIGTASANNSNALIIIDGAPAIEGTNVLSSLNSKDIESVTVLKDAASTALYGARGANGVILVTTKSGKPGKTKISLETRMGINAIGANSKFDKIGANDPGELYEFYWEQIYNDVYFGRVSGANPYLGNSAAAAEFASQHLFNYSGSTTNFTYNAGIGNRLLYKVPGMSLIKTNQGGSNESATLSGAYLVGTDGKLNPNASLIYSGGTIEDEIITNRFRQEYVLSASGANDKIDYHVSMGVLSDPSYIEWSKFERYTGRSNVNAQITDWLKAGAKFSYTYRKTNSQATRWGRNPGYVQQNAFRWVNNSTALDQLWARKEDGSIKYDAAGNKLAAVKYSGYASYKPTQCAVTDSPIGPTYGASTYLNLPLFFAQSQDAVVDNDMTANGYIRASFLKYFSAEANLTYDKTFQTRTRFYDTETAGVFVGTAMGSAIWKNKEEYSVMNTQQLLNYAQDMGKHHVDAMAGHEYYQYDYDLIRYGSAYSLIHDFTGYVNFLGTQTYSTFGSTTGGNINKYAMESYFGRANYIYDDKYYLSGSLRRDGSSKFKTKETRWGTFWSVGGGWRISAEPWMEGTKNWLDNLKVRASYGVIGNQNGIGMYSGYQTWSYSGSNWTTGATTRPQTTTLSKGSWVNDKLTWEHVHTTDAGIDFTLFGGKFSGNIDYFNKHTVDAIWPQNASYLAAGQVSLTTNTAGIRSRGYEIELNYQPVKTADWDVILSANATHYRTTLVALPEGTVWPYTASADAWSMAGGGSSSGSEYYRGVGMDYYNYYLYKYGGVAGNPGKTYYGSDGAFHTGYTKGDKDAGRPLYYHKVTADDGSKYGANYKEGDDVLVVDSALASKYEMGTVTPDLYGGFSANIRFKNFDFTALFAYQIGGKFLSVDYGSAEGGRYMPMQGYGDNAGTSISRELLGNTWNENNLSAKFPLNTYTGNPKDFGANLGSWNYTDLALFDASYLSIKNITLGYTLPKSLVNKVKISNLRIYVAADNPVLLYSHSGIDPRWSMVGGMEVGAYSYPYLSVYTFGVNLDF